MIKFLNLFTWWNGQTVGTTIYTKFFGVLVGTDEFGNSYFTTSDGKKRWVNYMGECDSSTISPIWYNWLHKTTNNTPVLVENSKKNNSLKHSTAKISEDNPVYFDYKPWKPKN